MKSFATRCVPAERKVAHWNDVASANQSCTLTSGPTTHRVDHGCVRNGGSEPMTTHFQPWPKPGRAWYAVIILATVLMLGTTETQIITFLIRPIKRDFRLSDLQMSILIGAAPSIFYACVGFPLARLVDSLRRNTLLSVALGIGGLATSLAGLTQHFWQFALCRMAVGGGSAISSPGTYSLLADYFPRERLARAIAVLALGLVVARALAPLIGASLVGAGGELGRRPLPGPGHSRVADRRADDGQPRDRGRGADAHCARAPAARRHRRRQTPADRGGLPLHLAAPVPLPAAVLRTGRSFRPRASASTCGGSSSCDAPMAGRRSSPAPYWVRRALVASMLGLLIGTRLTEWLARRHNDANLRTVSWCYLVAPVFADRRAADAQPVAVHRLLEHHRHAGHGLRRAAERGPAERHAQRNARPDHGDLLLHHGGRRHRHGAEPHGVHHRCGHRR